MRERKYGKRTVLVATLINIIYIGGILLLLYNYSRTPKEPEVVEYNLVITSEDPNYADYLLLSSIIYCEASNDFEESVAVGWVVMNRLNDKEVWGDDTMLEVLSRERQFAGYNASETSKFYRVLHSIEEDNTPKANICKMAALCVLYNIDTYKIPEDVQFFCSKEYWDKVKGESGNWGKYDKYREIGDTVFFYKY